MLMVTTTMGMLNGIHRHTTHLRPAVALHLIFVVRTSSLQDRLVDSSSAGNDSDHRAIGRRQNFLGARWELDASPLCVWVVGDDGGVVAGCAGKLSAIAGLLLNVADDGSFGHQTERQNVADGQLSLLAAVHELAGVHAFDGDEEFLADLVAVRVAEVHDGEWSATSWVVNDFLKK